MECDRFYLSYLHVVIVIIYCLFLCFHACYGSISIMKSIKAIAVEMRLECEPISMDVIWKNVVDDLWHREYSDYCPVCRSYPCIYKEYSDER